MLAVLSRTAGLTSFGLAIGSLPWGFALVVMLVFACNVGCATNEGEHAHSHIVYHHRPANYKAAVLRLDEIHRVLTGTGALPAAKEFSGPSQSHDHDDDSPITDEVISVGIFQEYFDIVRWLPTIAADNDLPKSEWDSINESCKQLGQLVQELERDVTLPELKNQSQDGLRRTLYCKRAKNFETAISELLAKLSDYDAWQEKVVN